MRAACAFFWVFQCFSVFLGVLLEPGIVRVHGAVVILEVGPTLSWGELGRASLEVGGADELWFAGIEGAGRHEAGVVLLDPAIGNLIEDFGLRLRVREQPARNLLATVGALGESAPGSGSRLLWLGELSLWRLHRRLENDLGEVRKPVPGHGNRLVDPGLSLLLPPAALDDLETVVFGRLLGRLRDLCSARPVFVKGQELPGGLVFPTALGDLLVALEHLAVLERVTEFLAIAALEAGDGNALAAVEGRASIGVLVVLVADAAVAAVVLGNAECLKRHGLIVCAVTDSQKIHFNFFKNHRKIDLPLKKGYYKKLNPFLVITEIVITSLILNKKIDPFF